MDSHFPESMLFSCILMPFPHNLLRKHLRIPKKLLTFAQPKAQMAESVDALVSNTSGAIHPGSIPGLGTETEVF